MTSPIRTIAVSTSIALVATQAFAAAAREHDLNVSGDYQIAPELAGQIDAALNRKDSREAVSSVFGLLARRMTADGVRLEDQVFQTLDGRAVTLKEIFLAQDTDATVSGSGGYYFGDANVGTSCYINCHWACHFACHGARGWR